MAKRGRKALVVCKPLACTLFVATVHKQVFSERLPSSLDFFSFAASFGGDYFASRHREAATRWKEGNSTFGQEVGTTFLWKRNYYKNTLDLVYSDFSSFEWNKSLALNGRFKVQKIEKWLASIDKQSRCYKPPTKRNTQSWLFGPPFWSSKKVGYFRSMRFFSPNGFHRAFMPSQAGRSLLRKLDSFVHFLAWSKK